MAFAAYVWCGVQAEQPSSASMKRVEVPYLMWMEWADLGGGEYFTNGDSLLFEHDCDVLIFDHVQSGRVEVSEGATVTMTPIGGGVSVEELSLNGTLVFYAPWVTIMDWNIVAGEHALIVMDLSTFPAHELREALPGEYHGNIELRSGRLTTTRGRSAEKLFFSELRVKDDAQFCLLDGACYAGNVVLSGTGWMNRDEAHAQGALLMESTAEHDATLSGCLTLSGDTSINVWRKGDIGRITSDLYALGHTIIKEGSGDLRLEGMVMSAPGRIEVRDGRMAMLQGWNSKGDSFVIAGSGVAELHGRISGVGVWQMVEAQAELHDAQVDARQMAGNGSLLLQDSLMSIETLHDFHGDIALRNSFLHAGVGEQVHLNSLSVDAMSSLCAELCHDGTNTHLCTERLHFDRGSKFELNINLCRDMLNDARSVGQGVLEGLLQFEDNCVLTLQIVNMDDFISHAYGEYLEFVLAGEVEGLPQLDQPTRALLEKYFGDSARLRNDDGRLILSGTFVTQQTESFHRLAAQSYNGRAGARLLDALFAVVNPQTTAPDGDCSAILHAQEYLIEHSQYSKSDHLSAAVAGASIPALVTALREYARTSLRELSADHCPASEGAESTSWSVKGKGGYAEFDGSATDSGYHLTTWGGSLGWRRCGRRAVVGLRLQAMYGDWRADSAENARADLQICELGAYCRVRRGSWEHSLSAQLGSAEAHINRSVSAPGLFYKTAGKTRGYTCGACYEIARSFFHTAADDGEFQVLLHCAVLRAVWNAYNEIGSDAALCLGRQILQCVEIGPGLRKSGETSLCEHRCRWELSGILLGDIGPSRAYVSSAFLHGSVHCETVRARAMTPFGATISAAAAIGVGVGEVEMRLDAELRQYGGSADASVGYSQRF